MTRREMAAMNGMMIFSLAFAVACAGGGATRGADTPPPPAPVFSSPETGTLFTERPTASTATISAAPAAVWTAVKRVYAEFEIPVTVDNAAAHQIGNSSFVKNRQLAGALMSQWLDCGTGVTGEKANEYRITASLLTEVLPDPSGGTSLRTTFMATARDVEGGTTNRLACKSTGRLEAAMIDHVKAALTKP